MSLAQTLTRADDALLDRVFQPIADRFGGKPDAFDIGMSLQIGAIVFLLAADLALLAVNRLGWAGAAWDALSAACGVWFYRVMQAWRGMVREGHANPLRALYRPLRLLALFYALFSVWQFAMAAPADRTAMLFDAASNITFVAGMYFIACDRRPRLRKTAPAPAPASPWHATNPT